ncbi:MAG: restriction endonuclease subunit S [Helicobacter sp.]|uniref:restriction endonuclease subunit S n=1 Tax=Helicobacter sp. TaxID=218 RepID=UPI002A909389|nr:restriction endonuclease subunit S [Helicobacter sp.]MDY5950281.1 restriction endonuclease subunit S [Helicobacter sp.]
MESCNTESSLDLPLESLSLQPFLQSLHKEQWQEVRLGEVAEITSSKRIFYSEYVEYGIPFYRSKEIIEFSKGNNPQNELFIDENKYNDIANKFGVPQANDILLTSVGTLGIPYLVPKDKKFYFKDGNLTWFKNFKNITSLFLFYWFKSPQGKEKLDSIAIGSTQQALTIQGMKNLIFLLPPLTIQQKIAEILSSFDDKIDLLHRQNKTLESLALTLFRHYFIDNPNRNEWELGKLGDLLLETLAGDWGKEQQDDENGEMVYCIRGTDIADLQNGLPNKTPIRYVKHKKLMQLQPNNGDIIFEISGGTEMQSTGRCIYINNDIEKLFDAPILFSNFCRLLRVKKAEYGYFLYLYLKFLYNNDEFFALENGTSGIKNLDYKVLLYQHEYTIPNEQQIIRFHKEIEIYYYKINQNKKQIQNLQAMRDMLLKAIFE